MRTILVSVLKDLLDFYADGYDKAVPASVRIGEVKMIANPYGNVLVSALEISHPDFGTIYVDETVESIREKIKDANSGGGGAPAPTVIYGEDSIIIKDGINLDQKVITHALGKVPQFITITPNTAAFDTGFSSNNVWYIPRDTITATEFTIKFNAPLGTTFDFMYKIE